jgi:hypothetical protein
MPRLGAACGRLIYALRVLGREKLVIGLLEIRPPQPHIEGDRRAGDVISQLLGVCPL